MTVYPTTGSASVDVAATPAQVWALVSDVTRIGEISPECYRAEWTRGHGPQVGNRFHGYNRTATFEWDEECEVTDAEPERLFAFAIPPEHELANQWRYTIEPNGTGCTVTESFDMPLLARPDVYTMKIEGRCERLQGGLEITLARLKAVLEAEQTAGD